VPGGANDSLLLNPAAPERLLQRTGALLPDGHLEILPGSDGPYGVVESYRALTTLRDDGRVRAIGVSNFMPHHLARLLEQVDVVPAVNQVELHPYFIQPTVQQADAEHGILTQAWSPIGGITFYPGFGDHRRSVMADPTIGAIAQSLGKTPRSGAQRGRG